VFDYTPANPCRCGFDGTQPMHQCHAGRNPAYPGGRCPNPALDRLVATLGSLAGSQLKFPVTAAHYCDACAREAGLIRDGASLG